MKILLASLFLNVSIAAICIGQEQLFQWDVLTELPSLVEGQEALGVAGPVSGHHKGKLIVAGGANFNIPYWENDKEWHDEIFVFDQSSDTWIEAGRLDHKLAYSAVLSDVNGIFVLGGNNGVKTFAKSFVLQWDDEAETVRQISIPSLPHSLSYGAAVLLDDYIYVAGGTQDLSLESAGKNFWRLDIRDFPNLTTHWEVLPGWDGPARAFNLLFAQHNGFATCIYLASGRRHDQTTSNWEVLTDVYEFNPAVFNQREGNPWRQRSSMPDARMGGTTISIGQSHAFVLSGADGTLYKKTEELKLAHPGFPKTILGYNAITDAWFEAGEMPVNQLTSHAFLQGNQFVLASGEIKPRVRSAKIWGVTAISQTQDFEFWSLIVMISYLTLLVGIGVYFYFRQQSTDEYLRAGQRVPWWAAGCSIFATMLSSITFMAIPAKTFATDWSYFLLNMCIIAIAPFIIYWILPFFRKLNVTSAYEYLELRFNVTTRIFGSLSYILFQIGRMAIVMYLPALALAAVSPFSIDMSILLMGILSIIYCALGGLEAVIWTDTLQTIVLLGGALLSLGIILSQPDIGISGFYETASQSHKFTWIEFNGDYTTAVFWVVIIGGIGQALVPYTSDQGVVQRYMSVSSETKARKSILTNAGLTFIASILFFSLGTALFVFYVKNPSSLDPTFQNDAVFPLFITNELPTGLAGLVIAGIFAAAQSTISTSMNSISTTITVDFIQRFRILIQDSQILKAARWLTVVFGILGTGFALLLANADIKSLWDSFIGILGLFGGTMSGLFLLGIFTVRANGFGAVAGALLGAVLLILIQQYTAVSFLLYASIGIFSTMCIGYLLSLTGREKEGIRYLTIWK